MKTQLVNSPEEKHVSYLLGVYAAVVGADRDELLSANADTICHSLAAISEGSSKLTEFLWGDLSRSLTVGF
jgi:hypothetical protein